MQMRDELLSGGYRVDVNGWNFVHVEGGPGEIGFQHGYLLAERIKESLDRARLWATGALKVDWELFREKAESLYIPHMPEEQRTEVHGIVQGMDSRGLKSDHIDIIALNGLFDTQTFCNWNKHKSAGATRELPPHVGGCSAFIATGTHTKGEGIVAAHNTWFEYLTGRMWNVILHAYPEKGNYLLMQTMPGLLASGTDWYINSSGLVVTETTISGSVAFNPDGAPFFTRARKAIQYAGSIDEWISIMVDKNNGGYANDWLIGDTKTGEIALLELGTFHHKVEKKSDGYFVGCNIAIDPEVRKETVFNYKDLTNSPCSRQERLIQLMEENKGKIDTEKAKEILADHFDPSLNTSVPSRGSVCGHVEEDLRGYPEAKWGPNYPGGSFDGKVTSSALLARGATWATWGKPCGKTFHANEFLKSYPAYNWQRELLSNIEAHPWTLFEQGFKA